MPNANKIHGDSWEREDLELWRAVGFPHAERTRAGYERDRGDLHLCPGVIVQNKWTKSYHFTDWFMDLDEQVANAKADIGILAIKRSRPGKSPLRFDALPRSATMRLLRMAGYGEPWQG